MGGSFSEFPSEAQGTKPPSEGFSIDEESFFGHKDLGEVAEVEIEVCALDQGDHPVLQLGRKGMRGFSACVSMQDARGPFCPYAFFQPLNLAPGQIQYLGRLLDGHLLFQGRANDVKPSPLSHGQCHLTLHEDTSSTVVPSFTPISSRRGDIFTLHLRGDIIIVQQQMRP